MKQGWEIKKLGEVLRVQNGYAFNSKLFTTETGTPLIRIRDIKNGIGTETNFIGPYDKKYEVKAGDFLIGMDGEFGCYEWKGDTALLNQRVCRLQEFSNKLYPRFLFYVINRYLKAIEDVTSYATVKHISSKQIEAIEIPLPPLPEQQRIVSILDACFAAIAKAKANAEQNLKNAKELFESYLQGVFDPSTSSGHGKGDGWEEKTLEELADESCTLSYGIVQPGEEFENGLPVIRPTDLTNRFIKVEGLKKIDPKLADGYKRTKLIGDELLLCVRGTTGVVSIATPELKNANVTRGIVPIRFNSKFIIQEFGYYLLTSNYVQKQIRAKTYGAALMQINIGDLRKILSRYPSIKDQQTIVRQLDALLAETQKLEAVYQKKIDDLEELKKLILQKAFAGELKTIDREVSHA
jgi:type I restriction enzyme S subunit